ncbi:nucleotidyltransferase family protein [Microvirga terricola]|uniref:Nucleotidyltransferase family protein n=1 Tax=Microvirga terricola TaxID=2719797 RepID=A0ABX0VFI6_9HYPH|nr:nucleotidyltransferase family protein [Microvirga terricola]NIX77944.1 nucleotidyltransferase family protein [Microvirga terricola]
MRTIAEIAEAIARQPDMMRLLGHVESLCLPDSWIGAGFIRNAVWDALRGLPFGASPLSDVDVIFLDPADLRPERDVSIEATLRALAQEPNWQVKNQARMHERNGDAPYRDASDAIAHWPETATAIASRVVQGKVEIIAPHGVEDLLGLIVRPTPAFARKPDVYRKRLAGKDWLTRWPCLTVIDP